MNAITPRYKATIFDIDFTLLDTEAFIFEAFYFTLKRTNIPQVSSEALKKLMGTSLEEIYKTLAPDKETATLAKIHRDFQAENIHLVTSFPNTEETLIKIKQAKIKIAAVTTRSKLNSQKTLEATKIMPYIDVLISKEDVPEDELKPHPRPILQALKQLEVRADELEQRQLV
ncbi:MAG: HAD hydrolase-like protein [Patescibacteria group bacterium]